MKLYADEDGAAVVRALDAIALASITRVEVPAALWRKQRIGELDAADTQVLVQAFGADFHGSEDEPPRFAVVALGPAVLDEAAGLPATHGLRVYDAVQLAAALTARHADPACEGFACFDARLRTAAAAHGFEPIP